MKTFTINNKRYNSKKFGMNLVCDISEMGINMDETDRKALPLLRAYFALCAERDVVFAGEEIEKHILSGGNLDELTDVMAEEMENSDFFHALNKETEEINTENAAEKKTKKN